MSADVQARVQAQPPAGSTWGALVPCVKQMMQLSEWGAGTSLPAPVSPRRQACAAEPVVGMTALACRPLHPPLAGDSPCSPARRLLRPPSCHLAPTRSDRSQAS